MRRSWLVAIVIAVAATAWVVSGQLSNGSEDAPVLADAVEETAAPLPSVRVMEVVAEPLISDLTVQGRTIADRTVVLQAELSGLIAEVLVERGERVAADQVIARIATNDRQARVDFASALVRQREIEFNAAEQLNQRGFAADTAMAEAEALLNQARAELSLAEIHVEHLTIRAPFAGVVNERSVEIGDFVDIGDPVATLVDLDPIRVAAQISERHVGDITVGTEGTIQLLAGQVHNGHVTYVSSATESATRTFTVEVEIDNPDYAIIEGLTAELHLPLREVMAHHMSPAVLTLADDGVLGVKAIDEANRVRFLPVEVLSHGADGVWLGGLPQRVRLISVGQEFVVPGQEVQPVSATDDNGEQPVS